MCKCRKRKSLLHSACRHWPLLARAGNTIRSCKDFALQYNESRGEIFELAHAALVRGGSGSEVLDWFQK